MSDYIPEDVLIKILTRVSPKSLIKFTCVSKSWHSLISSSEFVSLQLHHTKPTTSLPSNQLLVRCTDTTRYSETYAVYNDDNVHERLLLKENIRIGYPFRNWRLQFQIVGICNGLLCLSRANGLITDIILWNPVIRRRVALPKLRRIYQNLFGWCGLGFGFDSKSNDYKVVRLTTSGTRDSGLPKVQVYSLSVRNWSEIDVEFTPKFILGYFQKSVFVKGSMHWLASRREEDIGRLKNFIILFDISLEVLDEMALPEALRHREISTLLNPMVIQESLAICKHEAHVCSIWIMNKYGDVKSWSKMFNVTLSGVRIIHGLRMNGDILLTDGSGRLVTYNMDTGATVDLEISGTEDSFYISSYVESLALMNEGKVVQRRASQCRKRERD